METKLSLIGQFFSTLGTLLSLSKGVFIIDPNGLRKENEDYKPPKVVMREHEGAHIITIKQLL